jgi:hypothetical protein
LKFNKDDRVFLDIAAANLNVSNNATSSGLTTHSTQDGVFSDPAMVNPGRHPKDGYLYGDGSFRYLGEPFSIKIMSEVLRAVFGYKNITRAPGQSGTLKRLVLRPFILSSKLTAVV